MALEWASRRRADIDGLRAIAVLLVILNHLYPAAFNWGLLGVDIFFVISGFVITRSLLCEYQRAGCISVVDFYGRRVRRLLPALILMLAVSAIAAYLLLLPGPLRWFGYNLPGALFFFLNFQLIDQQKQVEFAITESPIIHLWSLAVEEQFYLLAPLALLLGRRWSRRASLWALAALILGSWLFSRYTGLSDKWHYIMLPSRAWEIAIGALLAMVRLPAPRDRRVLIAIAVGGLLLVLACVAIRGAIGAPNRRLLVVLGTALVIFAHDEGRSTIVGQMLGTRPMQTIGGMSYSLYLWHLPLITYVSYWLPRSREHADNLAILVGSFALSALSWRLVERPFATRAVSLRWLIAGGGTAAVALCAFALILVDGQGLPGRIPAAIRPWTELVGDFHGCRGKSWGALPEIEGCSFGHAGGQPDIVLLGDTHAAMYEPALAPLVTEAGRTGFTPYMADCKPLFGMNISADCVVRMDHLIRDLAGRPEVDIVILGVDWEWRRGQRLWLSGQGRAMASLTEENLTRGLDATIDVLRAAGKRVVLIGPIALPPMDLAGTMARWLFHGHSVDRIPTEMDATPFLARWQPAMSGYVADPRLAAFVQPHQVLCPDRCLLIRDGKSLFADRSHLTRSTVLTLLPAVREALGRVMY